MSVVVLAGGLSAERDVSLRSGRRLAEALRSEGMDVSVLDLDAALLPSLQADPPRVVIPLVHGAAGEDGSLADVLEALGVPYVGSGAVACRLAFDKAIAKGILAERGVLVPRGYSLPHGIFRDLGAPAVMAAILERLGLPLMVKPTRGGSALGATLVRTAEELPPAMVAAFAYGDSAMLEQYVPGTEVAVSVVDLGDGPVAWPAVEIQPRSGIYDYAARYTAGETEFFVPARISAAQADECARTAVMAHETLGLRDWSRVDFMVTDEGVYFLEANVAPGMTETSLFPQAAVAAGFTLGKVAAALVARH
ncbi:MAG: D-alanine--D-alanine ligase [Actinobacteria bacterium]|nr:D-alanine--D-alanine ligase [Actinomycetota bacterium]MCB8997020.1 D-alanine--D-alanine ligase [Actinomycetota bacterium]MCB9413989.1 D-alanine--D-alanine ligase [Actinomycetota bacterium]MCB9424498.1 D-alanine--D-alanine ligase [Actinomycetota bacterium]